MVKEEISAAQLMCKAAGCLEKQARRRSTRPAPAPKTPSTYAGTPQESPFWSGVKGFGSGLWQGVSNVGRGAAGLAETAAGGIGTGLAAAAAPIEYATDRMGITNPATNASWDTAKQMGRFTGAGAKNVGDVFGAGGEKGLMGRGPNHVTKMQQEVMDAGNMGNFAQGASRVGLGFGQITASAAVPGLPAAAAGGLRGAATAAGGIQRARQVGTGAMNVARNLPGNAARGARYLPQAARYTANTARNIAGNTANVVRNTVSRIPRNIPQAANTARNIARNTARNIPQAANTARNIARRIPQAARNTADVAARGAGNTARGVRSTGKEVVTSTRAAVTAEAAKRTGSMGRQVPEAIGKKMVSSDIKKRAPLPTTSNSAYGSGRTRSAAGRMAKGAAQMMFPEQRKDMIAVNFGRKAAGLLEKQAIQPYTPVPRRPPTTTTGPVPDSPSLIPSIATAGLGAGATVLANTASMTEGLGRKGLELLVGEPAADPVKDYPKINYLHPNHPNNPKNRQQRKPSIWAGDGSPNFSRDVRDALARQTVGASKDIFRSWPFNIGQTPQASALKETADAMTDKDSWSRYITDKSRSGGGWAAETAALGAAPLPAAQSVKGGFRGLKHLLGGNPTAAAGTFGATRSLVGNALKNTLPTFTGRNALAQAQSQAHPLLNWAGRAVRGPGVLRPGPSFMRGTGLPQLRDSASALARNSRNAGRWFRGMKPLPKPPVSRLLANPLPQLAGFEASAEGLRHAVNIGMGGDLASTPEKTYENAISRPDEFTGQQALDAATKIYIDDVNRPRHEAERAGGYGALTMLGLPGTEASATGDPKSIPAAQEMLRVQQRSFDDMYSPEKLLRYEYGVGTVGEWQKEHRYSQMSPEQKDLWWEQLKADIHKMKQEEWLQGIGAANPELVRTLRDAAGGLSPKE